MDIRSPFAPRLTKKWSTECPQALPAEEGDIHSLDFGVVMDGYYGDAAVTAPVGKVSEEAAGCAR